MYSVGLSCHLLLMDGIILGLVARLHKYMIRAVKITYEEH